MRQSSRAQVNHTETLRGAKKPFHFLFSATTATSSLLLVPLTDRLFAGCPGYLLNGSSMPLDIINRSLMEGPHPTHPLCHSPFILRTAHFLTRPIDRRAERAKRRNSVADEPARLVESALHSVKARSQALRSLAR
jgi:hypothetical protein